MHPPRRQRLRSLLRRVRRGAVVHEQESWRLFHSALHRHQRNNSFFSKLDMGKVFPGWQAAGHVLQTIDGFHEGCKGRGWLVGAATQGAATTQMEGRVVNEALDRTATRLMRKISPLVPEKEYSSSIPIGYKWNLFYTANVDCSRLGSVLTLNALALDIVVGK